jgi:23S rRNA A1618 N6-methylase RlmF
MYCIFLYTSSEYYEKEQHYNVIEEDETNKQCLICWLPSNENDVIKKIKDFSDIYSVCNCNPPFHYKCLEDWINRTSSCPICRIKITINNKISPNNYIKAITYFVFCFNLSVSMLRVATFISMINLFLLFTYNFYFIFYIKKEYFDEHYYYY